MHKTSLPLSPFLGLALAAVIGGVSAADGPEPAAPKPAPYPTTALADYVLGCMIANGKNPDTLRKCSCSIDFIAAAIPYADYERIETLMRLQQMEGAGRNAVYKGSTWAKDAVTHFKEIQAESTLRCF
ncbi:hypothetical protein [Candidatus Thiodictyon syntrophicum]|jgi:hypothetical protein|uniref:Uncharacterized protein n=1 Tax=Candidatus Thiodictyon syntrophicum TaxID=1166950 RepID=A0A2K8UJF5_9GAMM|nr:hypothetical protein [Candidatus Thiodictyon syntrophicum]AUB85665.1 hypothetical protein THSYN_32745 [Candidatus Thiodictyon syntrophicum]